MTGCNFFFSSAFCWRSPNRSGFILSGCWTGKGKTFLDPVVKPIERLTYKLTGVDPTKEQDWKGYAIAMLLFSLVSMLFTYAILRLQAVLPLNPQELPALSEHLSFNTAASFTTNTNWQSYGGESTMSYLSQMVALAIHNFVSGGCRHRHCRSVGAWHCAS